MFWTQTLYSGQVPCVWWYKYSGYYQINKMLFEIKNFLCRKLRRFILFRYRENLIFKNIKHNYCLITTVVNILNVINPILPSLARVLFTSTCFWWKNRNNKWSDRFNFFHYYVYRIQHIILKRVITLNKHVEERNLYFLSSIKSCNSQTHPCIIWMIGGLI